MRLFHVLTSPLRLRLWVVLAVSFALVSAVAAPAFALGGVTGTINGTVVDAATKAPVKDVTVTAASPSSALHAKTDARGFYAFAGAPVDTYTISFQAPGYEVVSLTGVTVQGDQTVTVDTPITKALQTIGRTSARAATSAFQPRQTTDSYQVSGAKQQEALGKSFNISQTQLQSSVPSIQQTVYGSSSIRGSTRTELAYQFDGINYTDPLTSQFQNSLGLNGTQSLQVNPGAGDATQGNAGAGAINLVVKRGARPAYGTLDLETVAYPFTHQLGLDYGWATPNGRFSNYSAFLAQNQERIYGPIGTPAVVSGTFFATPQAVQTRDFINNLVYKFGKDNSKQLQFLFQTRYSDFQFSRGGFSQLCYKTCDPNIAGTPTLTGQLTSPGTYFPGIASQAARFANFQRIIDLLPGQSDVNQNLYYANYNHQPVDVMKLEYSQTLDASTYWTNRLYRVQGNAVFNRPYDTQTTSSRVNLAQGGVRNGFSGDYIRQLGNKHQVTLNYLYEADQSIFDFVTNTTAFRSLALDKGYEIPDFIAPGQPCPTTDNSGTALRAVGTTGTPCGYLAPFFPGGIPRIPNLRAISPGYQQLWGVGIRDQFTVNPKMRIDFGVRLDGSNYQIVNDPGGIGNQAKHPRVTEPRFAVAYQFGNNDAVRFSYGRSVQFTPAGIMNSPVAYFPQFAGIPSRDSRTGLPATYCGQPKFTSPCANYAQQLHDEYIQLFGVEAFNVRPATFNNYDFSYAHQFPKGVSLKLTPFYKRGYDVNLFATPVLGADPVTGLPIFGPSTLTNLGIDKSTGVEFYLTKEAATGFSGFLNMTYVNRLQNVPPGYLNQLEDFYPSAPPQSLALGNLYKAGYLSPLTARLGVAYRTKGGLRVNPIVSFDKGFPIGAGNLTTAFVNGTAVVIPNTNVSVPGFGPVANIGSSAGVSQYVSPTNPGSVFSPNVAATRGTPETALAGGILSKARFNTDLAIEFAAPGTKNTFGVYISNLFNQTYSEPSLNTRYQPVATGIAGPQSGQISGAATFGAPLGFSNFGPERFGQNAYNLFPNQQPTAVRFYYQIAL